MRVNKLQVIGILLVLIVFLFFTIYPFMNYEFLKEYRRIDANYYLLLVFYGISGIFFHFVYKMPQKYHNYPLKNLIIDDTNREEFEYLVKGMGGILNIFDSIIFGLIFFIIIFPLDKKSILIVNLIITVTSAVILPFILVLYSNKFLKFPRKK